MANFLISPELLVDCTELGIMPIGKMLLFKGEISKYIYRYVYFKKYFRTTSYLIEYQLISSRFVSMYKHRYLS